MSEEEIKIECSNDVFKYTPDQTYDYIYELQQENSQLKERIEKAIPMLKELNIKIKDILKIGIDIKEISDIEEILKGDKE